MNREIFKFEHKRRSLLLLCFICFSSTILTAQIEMDLKNIGGATYKYLFDYSTSKTNIVVDSFLLNNFDFYESSKTITNDSGEVFLSFNSCYLFDADFEVIPGSEQMNQYGPISFENFCTSQVFSGSRTRNSFILPAGDRDNTFYFIYFKWRIHPELGTTFTDSLFYRTIDMRQRNGLGVVLDDEQLIGVDTTFNIFSFAATRHANQKSWWILIHNEIGDLYTLQSTKEGIRIIDTTRISSDSTIYRSAFSQATFNISGNLYAHNDPYNGFFYLVPFDDSTGMISGDIISRPYPEEQTGNGGAGVAFSGNDRFMYVNVGSNLLLQYDMTHTDLSEVDTIWQYDPNRDVVDDYPMFPWLFQLEPDCKIYSSYNNGLPYYQVIHNPNAKGKDCRFETGLRLPLFAGGATGLHPHWRTNTPLENWCDSVFYPDTTTSAFYPVLPQSDEHWILYPNPVQSHFTLTHSDPNVLLDHAALYDLQGKAIKRYKGGPEGRYEFSVAGVPPGIYLLHLCAERLYGPPEVVKLVVY